MYASLLTSLNYVVCIEMVYLFLFIYDEYKPERVVHSGIPPTPRFINCYIILRTI